jgi:hypothetical protein
LEGLAGAIGSAGQRETSARLLGASNALRRSASLPADRFELAEIERIATTARHALGDAGFRVAYELGPG